MNSTIYIAFFVPILIFIIEETKKKQIIMHYVIKRKTEKEKHQMIEYVKSFIDKECYIYTLNNTFKGIIIGVADNAILVKTKYTTDAVNLDFVLRVSEIQKRKK